MADEPVTTPDGAAPARTRRGTVGSLDTSTAAILEVTRGLGTAGAVAAVLYQMITGQIDRLGDDVDAVRADVSAMRAEVAGLRIDVTRLQVEADRDRSGPAPRP